MSFSGFSEDDIRKIATKGHDVNKQKGNHKISSKKVTFKTSHNANTTLRSKSLLNNTTASNSTQEIPENARLSACDKPNNVANKVDRSLPNHQVVEEKADKTVTEKKVEKICESVKDERKFKDLDEFEAKQKLIEEQNRKRKELLAKALADRTKRTQEEAQKLNEIQEEFKKLDAILSSDVKILRKEIELASVDYMECQKKYHKIEKEFLEAKFLLHQKQERKEMLTEHLCTIIEKNEERKAEKLNELLQRLQLSSPELNHNETSEPMQNNTIKENVVNNI